MRSPTTARFISPAVQGAARAGVIGSIPKVEKRKLHWSRARFWMGPQVSLPLGPSVPPDHPHQGPDCALKPDWDSGPRTELALGSVVRGGEEGPPHRPCDVCLSISPWSLTVEGPASRGQPESKAACPGWPEPSWDVPHSWLLDDQTSGCQGPPAEAEPSGGVASQVQRSWSQTWGPPQARALRLPAHADAHHVYFQVDC